MKKLTLVSITAKGQRAFVFVECDYVNGHAQVPHHVIIDLMASLNVQRDITICIGG